MKTAHRKALFHTMTSLRRIFIVLGVLVLCVSSCASPEYPSPVRNEPGYEMAWPMVLHDGSNNAQYPKEIGDPGAIRWENRIVTRDTHNPKGTKTLSDPIAYGNAVYSCTDEGEVVSIEPSAGSVKYLSDLSVSGTTGKVYQCGLNDLIISAIGGVFFSNTPANNGSDMTVPSEVVATLPEAVLTPLVAVGSDVFFATVGGHLVSYSIENASVNWEIELDGICQEAPCVVQERVIVSTGSRSEGNQRISCYKRANGDSVWESDCPVTQTSAVVYAEGDLFFGDANGNVFCLRLEDGAVVWSVGVGGILHLAPLVLGTDVIVSSSSGEGISRVLGLKKASGELLWERDLDTKVTTNLVGYGHTLLFGTSANSLLYMDCSSGQEIGDVEVPGDPTGLAIIESGVIVTTDRGSMLCVAPSK